MTSQWVDCVLHEEGWQTFLAYGVLALILIGLVVSFTRALFRKPGGVKISINPVTISAYDGLAVFIVMLALIVLIGFSLGSFVLRYPESRVSLDTPELPVKLETFRAKLQPQTKSRITLTGDAGQFEVTSGRYAGRCVADLFASICRQHADALVCKIDPVNREISISRK